MSGGRAPTTVSTLSRLTEAHEDEAVAVLRAAFRDDPLLKRVEVLSPGSFEQGAAALFRYACQVRFLLDWPLVGAWLGGRLVGVAAISRPEMPAYPVALFTAYHDLNAQLGPKATALLERIAHLAESLRPDEPHFQLGTLGVLPEAQRLGVGSELLRCLHQQADAHPTARGIWLETENPDNLAFYERKGYEVVGMKEHAGLTLYGLFRPTPP